MNEVEGRYIVRVMQAVRGNKREAARILGFDRKTLYRKLERYHIDVPRPVKGETGDDFQAAVPTPLPVSEAKS
jgi:hypothetical protein